MACGSWGNWSTLLAAATAVRLRGSWTNLVTLSNWCRPSKKKTTYTIIMDWCFCGPSISSYLAYTCLGLALLKKFKTFTTQDSLPGFHPLPQHRHHFSRAQLHHRPEAVKRHFWVVVGIKCPSSFGVCGGVRSYCRVEWAIFSTFQIMSHKISRVCFLVLGHETRQLQTQFNTHAQPYLPKQLTKKWYPGPAVL